MADLKDCVCKKKLWRICVNRVCPENTYNKNDSHHDSDSNTSI